jgi:hypothetical protein
VEQRRSISKSQWRFPTRAPPHSLLRCARDLVRAAAGQNQYRRSVGKVPLLSWSFVRSLPVSARQTSDGKLTVKTLVGAEIPAAILFERRGERVGYRIESAADEMVIDPPLLTGSVDTLAIDLEGILVEQGLYPDEAHAMVETWKDSWFEEGRRLIYIVPRGFIDKVLPLTITPSPDQIVRVFVGRLEIVTPATTQAVESALASKDEVTLNEYRRFLEPIERIVLQKHARSSQ